MKSSVPEQGRSLPALATERLLLRLARQEDVAAIVAYYRENRAFLAPWEPQRHEDFFTASYWAKEIDRRLRDFQGDRAASFFLFERDSNEIVGLLNFSNFVRGSFQSCNLGYSLARTRQKQGYMTEALQAAIAYTFAELQLHRIAANYMPRNLPSGRLLARLGFVIEGYAKEYLQINGRWEDHILTSRLDPSWKSS